MNQNSAVVLYLACAIVALRGGACRAQPIILHHRQGKKSDPRNILASCIVKREVTRHDWLGSEAGSRQTAASCAEQAAAPRLGDGLSQTPAQQWREYPLPRAPKGTWGPTTSGPFFTGTAEVEPRGSWYQEPYMFDYRQTGSSSVDFNQKLALGIGNNLEFDVQAPLILNSVSPPGTPGGTTVRQLGLGDSHLDFKYELTKDSSTYTFLGWPAVSLTADLFLPFGNTSGLRPSRYGADQFGNGTFQEGLSLLIRKRARPFSFYGQLGDLVEDPTHVSQGYGFNNGISTVQSGSNVRLVDGNLLYYSAAMEYVLNTKHGIGFLAEVDGQSQSLHNLFFGRATAPSFSYLSAAPEAEFTWPARRHLALTWGVGVNLPIERGDYPRILTPMVTLTLNFFGPNGSRNSE